MQTPQRPDVQTPGSSPRTMLLIFAILGAVLATFVALNYLGVIHTAMPWTLGS